MLIFARRVRSCQFSLPSRDPSSPALVGVEADVLLVAAELGLFDLRFEAVLPALAEARPVDLADRIALRLRPAVVVTEPGLRYRSVKAISRSKRRFSVSSRSIFCSRASTFLLGSDLGPGPRSEGVKASSIALRALDSSW